MPTNFASNATAPRMRSASAAIVCSASGRVTNRISVGVVEPALQDQLCRNCVASGLSFLAVNTGLGKLGVRSDRREALVNALHAHAEAARELAGEAFGSRGHLVLAAVSVERSPYDDHVGMPLVDQCSDRVET